MPDQKKPAPIVAELGRPETPEETAARKAESSRRHRSNQTLRNLILSLAASLGIMLFLVLVVVRPDPTPAASVDYAAVAEQAQDSVEVPLASPDLPRTWSANEAELRNASGVQSWYIGFITPDNDYIGFNQGIDANATWVDNLLEGATPTGAEVIDGVTWTAYDNRTADDPGNVEYALVMTEGRSTYVLNGTASDDEFKVLASAISEGLTE